MTRESWQRHYADHGYLVVPNVLTAAEIAALNAEAARICRDHGAELRPDGAVRFEDVLCLHFPHKLSTLMRDTMAHPGITDILTAIIGPNVKAMQSMMFVKNAGKPGQAWHQDEFYIPTRDRSLAGGWIALDDATIENGCLWVLPGSHKPGILWPMHPHQSDEFDAGAEAHGFPAQDPVPVEVKAGSLVFFNGYLLHRSLRNRSQGFRRALVNHYMSAESLLPWTWDGRLGTMDDNRDIIMVAGADPYTWKGLAEHTKPFLRRETPVI